MRPYNPNGKTYRGVRLLVEPTAPQVLDMAESCDFYEENHGLTYEESYYESEELSRVVEEMLDQAIVNHVLTPREAKILRLHFGIGVPSNQTLKEIGDQFCITGNRVREIAAKSLRKLRHPTRCAKLEAYV
jgi:RNA polymerase primary sigma factor